MMKNLRELSKSELLEQNGGSVPFPWPSIIPVTFPNPDLRDDRVMPWQFPILRTKYKKFI